MKKTVTATFVAVGGRFTKGNDRVSPLTVIVATELVVLYCDMGQIVGIEDGAGSSTKERVDLGCSEGIDEAPEDNFKGGRRDGIEDGFEDDALATKELPQRTSMILAAHENLMVTDLEGSLMACA